jgi:hypothetical protein
MWLDRYVFTVSEDFLDYEFYSLGPKGLIKKIVQFAPYHSDGKTFFNVTIGDWNERENKIDVKSVTNNNDAEKVFGTVGAIVLNFTEEFPDMFVHARGSTASRTRLYQMFISKYWKEIESLFHVFGFFIEGWQPFRKNVNYEAFLVRIK